MPRWSPWAGTTRRTGDGEDYVRFWPDDVPQGPYLPREEAERAVAMVAATFREVLALDAPGLPVIGPG